MHVQIFFCSTWCKFLAYYFIKHGLSAIVRMPKLSPRVYSSPCFRRMNCWLQSSSHNGKRQRYVPFYSGNRPYLEFHYQILSKESMHYRAEGERQSFKCTTCMLWIDTVDDFTEVSESSVLCRVIRPSARVDTCLFK